MRQPTLKQKALKVWSDNLKKGYVLRTTKDIPDKNIRAILKREKLIWPVTPGLFILKKPEDEPKQLFMLLYWQIAEKLLNRYEPTSIRGDSALLIHIGNEQDQKDLLVRTGRKTNYNMALPYEFKLSLVYDQNFDPRTVKKIDIAGRSPNVDIPEKVLVDCVVRRAHINPRYKSFVKGMKFDTRLLEAIYASNPRPIIFSRIAGIAEEVGRIDLVEELKRIMKTYTYYRVGKQTTRQQTKSTAERLVVPWVSRQEDLVRAFERELEESLGPDLKQAAKYQLTDLVENAQEHKRYDIYHSTTLEGYRITPEEVDAVVFGSVPNEIKDKDKHVEQIKNRMAILGYSEAFDFTIGQVKTDFGKSRVSEQLVKDIYYHLFKPSADSGIIDYFDLVSYRTIPAYIRGTRYVPPGPEKLTELMASFEVSINQVNNSVVKAILAHFFFVTIHPYTDGNGRTARLMMNYLLMTSGYQWITIRAEQRKTYFNALAEGQLHEDILPFGRLIMSLLKKSN